jgi:host factor-I protein
MEATKEESRQTIEPQFLLQALESGVRLRVGQMNKTEHEGILRDIGRYEINLDEGGALITLLKQEISYLTAPQPFLAQRAPQQAAGGAVDQTPAAAEPAAGRPNIQQEFLDKAIQENQLVTVYLLNGQRVRANIQAYDSFTILLNEGGKQHLFYKHSITTINR